MSDILNKIVAVKHEEVAAAKKRLSLDAMRADAESRVLTRDFEGALRAKIAKGQPVLKFGQIIGFAKVPIRPGEYDIYVPGYETRGLKGKFVVK